MDELEAHNVKFPKQLWADAKEIADRRYETLSGVLRRALADYVEEHPKPEPVTEFSWPAELPGTPIQGSNS